MGRRSINFISNLDLKNVSGGGSSVNVATYTQLKKHFDVNFVGPIQVPFDRVAKLKSNALRLIGLKGNYHFYSDARLRRIARNVRERIPSGGLNFFHGITPWIEFKSDTSYFAYTDACFATYVEVFNNKSEFAPADLDRIYQKEAAWLQGAAKVFFRSMWALKETVRHYSISGSNFEVVGLGGFVPIPERDVYNGAKSFIFISKEFVPKGGKYCLEAMKRLSRKYPEVKLKIIGDAPPREEIAGIDNVEYIGFLRKENPEDFKRFQTEIANAFALIHPSTKDTNALVITEVGYYGCPSIASNSFAIPEFIREKETGLLLDVPLSAEDLERKMEYLLLNDDAYRTMRRNVRAFTTQQNTWDAVGDRLAFHISQYA